MYNNPDKSAVNRRRWLEAQDYEKSFWEKLARKIENGAVSQLDWYQWKATELEKRLSKFVDEKVRSTRRVLEIGSGPIGIVNFLIYGELFAIDPLEDFYKKRSTLTKLRKPEVTYLKGSGELLPFPDGFFSIVIIDNVIDHTHMPGKILQEILRVLDKDGLLYLAVNIHTKWGAMVHKLLAALYIDKGHPYTFTEMSIQKLLITHQFKISGEEIEDYYQIKQKNCKSKSLKDRIKGYVGISEFQYNVFCCRELNS